MATAEADGDGFEFLSDPVGRFPLLAAEAGEYTPAEQPVTNQLDTVDDSNIFEAGDAPRIL